MGSKLIGWDDVWLAVVNAVLNLQVPQNVGTYFLNR
jgi:hypothetical protein